MTFLCFGISVDHHVRAARNVIAATPEGARDAAREVWKDRQDVRSVEVWLDGAIVFQDDCEAPVPQVFSTATPVPQRAGNGVGAPPSERTRKGPHHH